MAATLSSPLTLRQDLSIASTSGNSRLWKRERTSHRRAKIVNDVETMPLGRAKVDTSQVDAALREWGVPSKIENSAPNPTCAVSWDESSVKASCSYLQRNLSCQSTGAHSLDQWDPSISFSPFSFSSLETLNVSNTVSDEQFGNQEESGRVLVIGKDDGTVVLLRALGRQEDRDQVPEASPDISFSPASASPSRSSSMMSFSSRLRSPDAEQHSLNLSAVKKLTPTQLSPLLNHDRSFASLASRSTVSTPSTQTYNSATVNVHVEDNVPVDTVETNVTATGHSAHTASNNQDAEHALEAQMAAADRNDHQHGLVGGVIERLGFSHHHSRHAAPHDPAFVPAISPTMIRSRSNISSTGVLLPEQTEINQPKTADSSDRILPSMTSKSQRGHFEPLFSIATDDRSPVVALRVVPVPLEIHGSHTVGLLVVHEEGLVSLWSINDGRLLWETRLSCPTLAEVPELKQEVATSATAHVSSVQLLMRPSTPLSRISAGSLRPKSSKAELSKAAARQDVSRNVSRAREVVGVTLCSDVQTFRHNGKDHVALWDMLSCILFFLDLCTGKLVAKETVDDTHATCVPSIISSGTSGSEMLLVWLDNANKFQTRPIKLPHVSRMESNTMTKDGNLPSASSKCYTLTLPQDFAADRLYFLPSGKVLVVGPQGLRIFDLMNAQEQTIDTSVVGVIGATSDLKHLLIRTSNGTALVELSGAAKDSLNIPDSFMEAKMYISWNTPDGLMLNKMFAVGPSKGNDKCHKDSQVVLWDRESQQMEEVEVIADQASALTCSKEKVTAVLPMSLERIAIAVNGELRLVSLTSLSLGSLTPAQTHPKNSIGPGKEISLLRSAVAPRSGNRYILGATQQGDIAFWNASTLALLPSASRCISTAPIEALIVFGDEDNTIRLHGCVACVSADSAVTVILLETFKTQYMIPGRGARLELLATRADEILLIYDDGKARVWDLRTQELRRSIAIDQAQALVDDGKGWWSIKQIDPYSPLHSGTTGVLSQSAAARDGFSATMRVDFRRAIEAASRSVKPLAATERPSARSEQGSETEQTVDDEDYPLSTTPSATVSLASPAAKKAINIIRPLLIVAFPLGLDSQLDMKLSVLLDLDSTGNSLSGGSALFMGLHNMRDSLLLPSRLMQDARTSWSFHPRVTTVRSLICCALLRVLAKIQELHHLALEMTHFVETKLHSAVGQDFAELSLDQLASSLLDNIEEVQTSSRTLFRSALSRLDEVHIENLCEIWQPLLPHLQPGRMTSSEATNALSLLGNMAVERFKWMNPKLLKDVALSIALIVSSAKIADNNGATGEAEQRRLAVGMAIDLCRAGFSIWQHYFDATEIVRSLFALSTTGTTGVADGGQRALARKATLQIAQDNTPLFMTTLSLDILHAQSAAHCAATMRLVAFMVRKRPLVLLPNLPRLAEAVVKSLDPTMTEMREAVVNAATVMIGELVSTYPTIAFHGRGQRLAVGTHEGAVIMYDLKTATRLYVIEGHRHPLNGCSFSPDGRRLITLSLAEKKLLVWKVGAGFTSFFTPGTIPRQGGTDSSGAFRSFDFNVGRSAPDDESSSAHDLLNAVQFEWHTSQRSVRVILGQAQLNISVD